MEKQNNAEVARVELDTPKNNRSRLKVGTHLTRAELLHLALMSSENRAASSAANLSAAVPLPPLMIAPAWPIRRPFGAVAPAMGNLQAGTLRAMAVQFALKPGERLNEVEIARQLDMSRAPLREAMNPKPHTVKPPTPIWSCLPRLSAQ